MKQRATGSTPVLATKIMDQEITLSLLINDWIKQRGLKWRCDPKRGKLEMRQSEPLDIDMWVYDDHVSYDPPVVFGSQNPAEKFVAADPHFFDKLESAMRHGERWNHLAKNVKMICDILEFLWGPPLSTGFRWLDDSRDYLAKQIKKSKNKFSVSRVMRL